ncbi:MAG: hypothetical protein M1833_003811 [Piccolia ochrophora]|nr:MAG: hypothetical protein M1833_003811 [Piccolia ochrophora]
MSSGISIQRPQSVLPLPRPLETVRGPGRYHAACVWGGTTPLKKRKRPEIVVAIDGEGVNIYNIRSPKQVTSYALPPQTFFTCDPCCVYEKRRDGASSRRLTYASTVAEKRQIICFSDRGPPGSGASTSTATGSSITTYALGPSDPAPFHLDILSSYRTDHGAKQRVERELVVVFENGDVHCFSEALDERTAKFPASTVLGEPQSGGQTSSSTIEYAALSTFQPASTGISQGIAESFRLGASPGSEGGDGPRMHLLVLVSRPSSDADLLARGRHVHVLAINPSVKSPTQAEATSLQALFSLEIPNSREISSGHLQFSVDLSTGSLHQCFDGVLSSFELSTTSCKPSFRIAVEPGSAVALTNLSKNLVLAATTKCITIYDVQYQSVQSSVKIPDYVPLKRTRKRRKIAENARRPRAVVFDFLSYFTFEGLVLGLSVDGLVGMQVQRAHHASSAREQSGGRGNLLHAMNRGSAAVEQAALSIASNHQVHKPHESYRLPHNLPEDRYWMDLRSQMNTSVEERDVEGFERVFAESLGIKRDEGILIGWEQRRKAWADRCVKKDMNTVNGHRSTNGIKDESTNGQASNDDSQQGLEDFPEPKPLPGWKWLERSEPSNLAWPTPVSDQEKLTYAIGKIFAPPHGDRDDHQLGGASQQGRVGDLKVAFHAPNVLTWLIRAGGLSKCLVEKAIKEISADAAPLALSSADLVGAIVDLDPGMRLLLDLLQSPSFLDPQEIVYAITRLMASLEYPESIERRAEPLLTEDKPSPPPMEEEAYKSLRNEEEAAERDLHQAMAVLGGSEDAREEALTVALFRLSSFSNTRIRDALKASMTRDEIVSLIHLLRVELANNGWLTRYLDEHRPAVQDERVPDWEVSLITNLLGCAMDAIGTGGWIFGVGGTHDVHETEDLISALQAEVSAALEGVEEAIYLQGLLTEVMRYGKSVSAVGGRQRPRKMVRGGRERPRPKQAVGPRIVTAEERAEGSLPLGLKADDGISPTLVGAGGVIQYRTRRDIQRLKSMRVGKHTRERIIIEGS